ncbi:GNAT family N-acetyltransferase [Deinococcus navajonensis]|uniref:GNAT family N-acetyltransferase n=1 Tax=Deinococcus navajonensis TaxID=309884 RepID=A0ABV8XL65_9DEIO
MTVTPALLAEVFDHQHASAQDITALTRFSNAVRAEKLPDDPALEDSDLMAMFSTLPPFVDLRLWVVRDGDQMVGRGQLTLLHLEDNRHLAQFEVMVLPAYRRRGLGRALFQEVVSAAQAGGRTLLVTETTDRVPAGALVMAAVGAQPALVSHANQLDLLHLPPGVLEAWANPAAAWAQTYELVTFDGPLPDARLAEFAELLNVMNTAPRGELDIEDQKLDEETLRGLEQMLGAPGRRRLLTAARHRQTGQLVGYTELRWHDERPRIVTQEGTGVMPAARGQGLGRVLKAANLASLLAANAAARFVRTHNADSNAAMLAINEAMGFAPYFASTTWQLKVGMPAPSIPF